MAEAAFLELPYPEAAVVEADTLEEQNLALAADLPERPLVLGGDCCAHIGAIEGLTARQDRLAVVWLDAHGDLNTPATSPSGNTWGMPLRMILDSGAVDPDDVALVGARALEDVACVYVALDGDVVEPSELSVFMPEPGGLSLDETEALLAEVAERASVLGAGFTGLSFEPTNVEPLTRL